MELQKLEKSRLYLYGNILRHQSILKLERQRNQKQQRLKREAVQLNEHIKQHKTQEERYKLQTRRIEETLAKQNQELILSRKGNSQRSRINSSSQQAEVYSTNSANVASGIISTLHADDEARGNKLKATVHQQANLNAQQLGNKILMRRASLEQQKQEQRKHVESVGKREQDSLKYYEGLQKKHQQNMDLFSTHQKWQEQTMMQRAAAESFIDRNDSFQLFKRDDRLQRFQNNCAVREVLRQQMSEEKLRKSQQQESRKVQVDLSKSMLASVLMKAPRYDPKQYNETLQAMMHDEQQKKRQERDKRKEFTHLQGIFGGLSGRERFQQIKRVDRTLGIPREYDSKNAPQSARFNPETLASKPNRVDSLPPVSSLPASPASHRSGKEVRNFHMFDIVTGRSKVMN